MLFSGLRELLCKLLVYHRNTDPGCSLKFALQETLFHLLGVYFASSNSEPLAFPVQPKRYFRHTTTGNSLWTPPYIILIHNKQLPGEETCSVTVECPSTIHNTTAGSSPPQSTKSRGTRPLASTPLSLFPTPSSPGASGTSLTQSLLLRSTARPIGWMNISQPQHLLLLLLHLTFHPRARIRMATMLPQLAASRHLPIMGLEICVTLLSCARP